LVINIQNSSLQQSHSRRCPHQGAYVLCTFKEEYKEILAALISFCNIWLGSWSLFSLFDLKVLYIQVGHLAFPSLFDFKVLYILKIGLSTK